MKVHFYLIFLISISCSKQSSKDRLPSILDQTKNLELNIAKNSVGDSFSYPIGIPRLSTVIVVLNPGESLPLKKHPVPIIHNIIQGELTVEYPDIDTIITKKSGETYISVNNQWHTSKNNGSEKLILVGTIIGEKGTPNAIMKN